MRGDDGIQELVAKQHRYQAVLAHLHDSTRSWVVYYSEMDPVVTIGVRISR